jgi:hypothetical protein
MRRHYVGAAVVVVAEVYLYYRYAQLDAWFHYWLHGLLGGALGLAALTVARLVTRRQRTREERHSGSGFTPWEVGGLGHLYAAFPDVLFLSFGVPHLYWMDVFAFHVTVHFVPRPLVTVLVLFLLSLAAYGLVLSRRPRTAAATASVAGVAFAAALILAAPVPASIQDLRSDPRLAWHGGYHQQ